VLAALGLVVSQRRRDVQRTVLTSGDELTAEEIARSAGELGAEARRALGEPQAQLSATYELRYRGQSFELAIPGSITASPTELRAAFEAEHEDRYGYSDPEQTLELVTIRVTAATPGADVALAGSDEHSWSEFGRRVATLSGQPVELDVLRGEPAPGTEIEGPAIVELRESTVLVPSEWSGEVDGTGTIHLHRAR
jgi:N-methylhydantoinase A